MKSLNLQIAPFIRVDYLRVIFTKSLSIGISQNSYSVIIVLNLKRVILLPTGIIHVPTMSDSLFDVQRGA